MISLPFDCPRTCPSHAERWCRFRKLLHRLGPVKVDSHTARIKVEFNDTDALRKAVEFLGGNWIGPGTHKLFEGPVAGHGFNLPGWRFPLVLGSDGQLSYDDYRGAWGDVALIEKLRGEYIHAVAERAAQELGWPTERTTAGALIVHHSSGGSLTVAPSGVIDANGFQGQGCHDAITALNLPLTEVQAKPEFGQVACEVQVSR
jgi:hypothetical protein